MLVLKCVHKCVSMVRKDLMYICIYGLLCVKIFELLRVILVWMMLIRGGGKLRFCSC